MKQIYLAIALLMLLTAGCGTSQKTATAPSPYERKPITEVSQKQLELDNMLIEAQTQHTICNIPAAIQTYQKLIQADATCDAAYYGMGEIMLAQGMTDSALHYITKAQLLNSENIWYRIKIIEIHQQTNNTQAMIAEWEKLIKQKPDVPEYYYELSNAHIMDNDLESAISVLNQVEKRYGIVPEISMQKQRLWTALNRPSKAKAEIEALSKTIPQEKKYVAMLAELEMKEKNHTAAEQYYKRILEIDPDDEYTHISLANLYKQTNQTALILPSLTKGLSNPNLDAPTKLKLVTLFYSEEEFYTTKTQEVLGLIETISKSSNDSIEVAAILGGIYMEQNDYPKAAHYLKLYLTKDSSNYTVWESLLISLTETADHEASLQYATRAINLFPWTTLPYYVQGLELFYKKNYEEAIVSLTNCVEIGFNNGYLETETYCLIAENHYHLGDTAQFIEYYEKAIKSAPNETWIKNNYAYFSAEMGTNLDRAYELARLITEKEPKDSKYQDTLAWVLYKKGEYQEALKHILKAILLDGSENQTLKKHLIDIKAALPQ